MLLIAWLTTFAVCVVGSIFPLVNTELYLISAAALAPTSFALPLVVAATLGQMLGKIVMYYAGSGVIRVPSPRLQRGLASLQARLEERPAAGKVLLFSSATVGLPPLYAMAIACGAVRMNLLAFFLIGTAGRFLHFGAIVLVPYAWKTWAG